MRRRLESRAARNGGRTDLRFMPGKRRPERTQEQPGRVDDVDELQKPLGLAGREGRRLFWRWLLAREHPMPRPITPSELVREAHKRAAARRMPQHVQAEKPPERALRHRDRRQVAVLPILQPWRGLSECDEWSRTRKLACERY